MTTVGSTVGTGLAGILGGLSPIQLFNLGNHLTSSNEARALGIVAQMTTPAMAAALVGSLAAIPNVPPGVMTRISLAMANPANFGMEMADAIDELQAAVVHPGIIGNLLGQ